MHAFSAADSVSIAIQRTRNFLFRPFSWGTYLKLGLVAIITEGTANNFRSSGGGGQPSRPGPMINPPFDIDAVKVAAAVAACLLALLLAMWIYYLITRLRFAFFHCLTSNTKEIRPGWHLYREPATRFFWLNVIVGLCFLLVAVLVSIPFVTGFWRLFHAIPPGGHPDIALLLSLVLPLIPLVLLFVLAGILIDVVLRDWMLPHFAVDNATAGEAWSAVWSAVAVEKKQFFVYALLRLALPIVAMAVLFMLLLIPGLMVAGSIGALVYAIHSAFAGSSGGSAEAGLLLQIFFGSIGFLLMLLAGICLGGPVSTGIREYALTFYGGRYKALGDLLYPPAASPPPASHASVTA
jgi:hypothetical protein